MKVKTGELKTHLSRYLRQLKDSEEGIVVCVRDQPVAYLTSIKGSATDNALNRETAVLRQRLQSVGLLLGGRPPGTDPPVTLLPQVAGDGRTDVCSIEQMRGARDW